MPTRDFPFLKIESDVLLTKSLSANQKWVYTVIKSFLNRKSKLCIPSIKKIVERAELSRPTVLNCRKKLRTVGLISWEEQTGWKKSTRYQFTLEYGSEQEILGVIENLQMVKKETIVEGQKENQHMVKKETIYGLAKKIGSMRVQARDSSDSQMVKQRTTNHINQKNKTNSMDGTDDRLTHREVGGLAVPQEPAKTPMPDTLKEVVGLTTKTFPPINEEERKAELQRQADAIRAENTQRGKEDKWWMIRKKSEVNSNTTKTSRDTIRFKIEIEDEDIVGTIYISKKESPLPTRLILDRIRNWNTPAEAQISTRLHFLYVVRANTYTSIVKTIRNNGLIGGIGALIKQAKTGLVKQEGGDISQEYFDQAVKRLNDLLS